MEYNTVPHATSLISVLDTLLVPVRALWLVTRTVNPYHERAQIPYPDIYGLLLAHDTKISVGAQNCTESAFFGVLNRLLCFGCPCMWTDIFVLWASNKPITYEDAESLSLNDRVAVVGWGMGA